MPTDPPTGGASVSRRAIADLVRAATLGSYGVAGFASSPFNRLLAWLGFGQPGIAIDLQDDGLHLELDIEIAYGLPVAEVARQVDSAVRYAVRRALAREVADVRVRVDGLVVRPAVDRAAGGDSSTRQSTAPRRARRRTEGARAAEAARRVPSGVEPEPTRRAADPDDR